MRLLVLALAAVGLASVTTAVAQAATTVHFQATDAGTTVYVFGDAADNRTQVSLGGGRVRVADVVPIAARSGNCEPDGPSAVACEPAYALPPFVVRVSGGPGDDSLTSPTGFVETAVLNGGPGDDRLSRRASATTSLRGGPGDDLLLGRSRPRGDQARMLGGPGRDRLLGGAGFDVMAGGSGRDVLVGRGGGGFLDGDGCDTARCEVVAQPSPDLITGGEGPDVAAFAGAVPVTVDLRRQRGGSRGDVDRLRSIEGAAGGDGADRLRGDAQDNELRGGDGDDRLTGAVGADTLDGQRGRDRVRAGPGPDDVDHFSGPRDDVDTGPGADRVTLGAAPLPRLPRFLRCGAGRDRIGSLTPITAVPADCERFSVGNLAFDVELRRRAVVRVFFDEWPLRCRVGLRLIGDGRVLAVGRTRRPVGLRATARLRPARAGRGAVGPRPSRGTLRARAVGTCRGGSTYQLAPVAVAF